MNTRPYLCQELSTLPLEPGLAFSPAGHRHLGFEQSHSQVWLSQPLPPPINPPGPQEYLVA